VHRGAIGKGVLALAAALACSDRSARWDAGIPDSGATDASGDLAAHGDGGSPSDGGVDPDGACARSPTWTTEPRTIDSVQLVSGMSRIGATDRLLVTVGLRSSCEVLAGIEVVVTPGGATDFIGLRASAWVPEGLDCLPSAPTVERVVSIPGRQHGNLMVIVTDDNSTGGALRLDYDREWCSGVPECQCGPGAPAGSGEEWSSCMTDCSCVEGLSCIGFHGLGGPLWNCAQSCSDFMDCDWRETCLPPIPDGAPYVCSLDGDLCYTDDDCPDGFTCTYTGVANYCEDGRQGPTARTCACDEDCPEGHICAQSAPSPVCEIPCLADSWCPEVPADELICLGHICVFTD